MDPLKYAYKAHIIYEIFKIESHLNLQTNASKNDSAFLVSSIPNTIPNVLNR